MGEETPVKRGILPFLKRRISNWNLRHQLPFNFAIHMVGIPLAVSAIPMFFLLEWYWGASALFLGYLLQLIGHLAEGNDVGEWAAVKKMLGLPYVGIASRWNPTDPNKL